MVLDPPIFRCEIGGAVGIAVSVGKMWNCFLPGERAWKNTPDEQ
jgi:hypothetical protein